MISLNLGDNYLLSTVRVLLVRCCKSLNISADLGHLIDLSMYSKIAYALTDTIFTCMFPQITYIETSAKDPPMNVDKAFHELVRVIR